MGFAKVLKSWHNERGHFTGPGNDHSVKNHLVKTHGLVEYKGDPEAAVRGVLPLGPSHTLHSDGELTKSQAMDLHKAVVESLKGKGFKQYKAPTPLESMSEQQAAEAGWIAPPGHKVSKDEGDADHHVLMVHPEDVHVHVLRTSTDGNNGVEAHIYKPKAKAMNNVKKGFTAVLKGDVPGHEFHGNQWVDGGGRTPPGQVDRAEAKLKDHPQYTPEGYANLRSIGYHPDTIRSEWDKAEAKALENNKPSWAKDVPGMAAAYANHPSGSPVHAANADADRALEDLRVWHKGGRAALEKDGVPAEHIDVRERNLEMQVSMLHAVAREVQRMDDEGQFKKATPAPESRAEFLARVDPSHEGNRGMLKAEVLAAPAANVNDLTVAEVPTKMPDQSMRGRRMVPRRRVEGLAEQPVQKHEEPRAQRRIEGLD